MTIEINDDTTIQRARDLMEAPLDRDLVGLNLETGLCYGFNETAASVWRHLTRPATFSALLEALRGEYAMDADECRDDVVRIVGRMAEEGLVTVSAAS